MGVEPRSRKETEGASKSWLGTSAGGTKYFIGTDWSRLEYLEYSTLSCSECIDDILPKADKVRYAARSNLGVRRRWGTPKARVFHPASKFWFT